MSDPYANIGAYIQYMAVSVGYSVDMNNIIGHHPANHQKIEYTFNCARFNIEGHIWKNTGGTYVRTFGKYNNGHLIKRFFEGVKLKEMEVYGFRGDAGHDYGTIETKGYRKLIVEGKDGKPEIIDNPKWEK